MTDEAGRLLFGSDATDTAGCPLFFNQDYRAGLDDGFEAARQVWRPYLAAAVLAGMVLGAIATWWVMP